LGLNAFGFDLLGLDKKSEDDFPEQGYTPERVKDTQRKHQRKQSTEDPKGRNEESSRSRVESRYRAHLFQDDHTEALDAETTVSVSILPWGWSSQQPLRNRDYSFKRSRAFCSFKSRMLHQIRKLRQSLQITTLPVRSTHLRLVSFNLWACCPITSGRFVLRPSK
jgi:hypothetical protein